MLIMERRATANHAEYGPILAHMGLFRRNEASKVDQNRRLGMSWGDDWAQNRPQRRTNRRLVSKGRFLCVLRGPTAGNALI